MSHPAIHKIACGCECGCSALLVTKFDQWDDEPEELFLEVAISYHADWRDRLRAAWRVLRGKDPWLHGLVFQGETLARLREAIR